MGLIDYDIDKVIKAMEAEARHIVDSEGKPIGKCIDINRAVELIRAGSSRKGVSKICTVTLEVLDYSAIQMAYAICKYYLRCNSEKELALIDLEELVKHINAYVEAERLTGGVSNGS